jgi:hypothetical protein
VWRDEDALDDFLAAGRERWAQLDEWYAVRLRRLGGHGRWRGREVLDGMTPGGSGGPVAVLTRADVRLRAWSTFVAAGGPVSTELQAAEGLLAVCGMGEAPVLRQATFSLWRSAADLERFARSPHHAEVVRRTRAEGWYGEELFARFEPYGSQGTWDGRDPLRA